MKNVGIIKRALCISLIFLMCINSFAAVVSDNDGSAFITKAEFDSLKNNFQAQIDNYNQSIDSKIDGAIASYLSGIRISNAVTVEPDLNVKDYYWVNNFSVTAKARTGQAAPRVDVWNGETKVFKPKKSPLPVWMYEFHCFWGDWWSNATTSMYFFVVPSAVDAVTDKLDTNGRGKAAVVAGGWNYMMWVTDEIFPSFLLRNTLVAGVQYPVLVNFGLAELYPNNYNQSLVTWSDINTPAVGRGWNNAVFGIFDNVQDHTNDYVGVNYESANGFSLVPAPNGVRNGNGKITWRINKLSSINLSGVESIWVFNDNKTAWGYADRQDGYNNTRDYTKLLLGNSTDTNEEFTMTYVTDTWNYGTALSTSTKFVCDITNNTISHSGYFYINGAATVLGSNATSTTNWKNAFSSTNTKDKTTNKTQLTFKSYVYKTISSIYNEKSVNTGYNLKLPDGFPIYKAPQKGNAKFSIKINTTNDGTAATKVSFNNGKFTGNSSNMYKYNGETKLSDTLYELSPDANGEIFVETHVEAGDVIYVRLDPKDELAKNEAKVVDLSNLEIKSLN